jgi:carbon storage regulator
MLVLTRKAGESLVLETGRECITVAVVAIRGDKVRIGVDAPQSTIVVRDELARRLRLTEGEEGGDANG